MLSRGQLEKRRKRSKMVIAVRIMPAGGEGELDELVHTLDVSAAGAQLGGIRKLVKPGEVLTVQRNRKTCDCKVIWVRQLEVGQVQIGIELIDADERFWGLDLSHEIEDAEALKSLLSSLSKSH